MSLAGMRLSSTRKVSALSRSGVALPKNESATRCVGYYYKYYHVLFT